MFSCDFDGLRELFGEVCTGFCAEFPVDGVGFSIGIVLSCSFGREFGKFFGFVDLVVNETFNEVPECVSVLLRPSLCSVPEIVGIGLLLGVGSIWACF